ncbi:MAG: nucleotidyltransferase domain-containing protein [Chloroflexota bacterium]|nr:nucleotidyltransferase domain-containing protein [Chloroflexota bacterium]
MVTRSTQIPIAVPAQQARVRSAFPHLEATELEDLTRIIDALLRTFRPESIYVFGSQARGTPSRHSDVDLLVLVPDAGEYPHHLAQEAYRVVGHHVLPLDIVFMSRDEFEWRTDVVTSLPAAVVREGKLLYAATTA